MESWKGYQHGVNLGGWLSQCDYSKDRFDHFIQEEDIKTIASWKTDHVRVPVDYNLVEDEHGNYLEEGFAYIRKAIGWCRTYGLNMVLDLHKTYGYSFDVGEKQTGFFSEETYQERFYRLWEQFARRFGENCDMLAFELLNEVTDASVSPIWNRIADTCIRRIRAIAPTIPILVGGYWNNSIDALHDLALPLDENIIYNFHCYDPGLFTHQGAYWVAGMDPAFRFSIRQPLSVMREVGKHSPWPQRPDEYEGLRMDAPLDASYFKHRMAKAVKIAEERNVRLYCGEYGVINLADPEDTVRWYRAIHEAFEEYGIARAAWSYKKMDFGLIDDHLKAVLPQIIELL